MFNHKMILFNLVNNNCGCRQTYGISKKAGESKTQTTDMFLHFRPDNKQGTKGFIKLVV